MWTITQSESGYHVIHDDEGDYLVAFQSEDIARRIVASVSACTGLATEQLERCGDGGVQRLVELLSDAREYVLTQEEITNHSILALTNYDAALDQVRDRKEKDTLAVEIDAALAPFAGDTEGVE